ncbi:ATP-binding protein [Actinomadura scrupuli]|uniref:ATP-binding protein n=1 Tax=Actinomadura scrupuli TaxID=559629 RepID=UPI003D98C86A
MERSVAYARQFVRDLLGSDHPAMCDANIAMCELFTNSLQHSRSGDGGQITVVVATGDGLVQISVVDEGSDEVRLEVNGDLMAESGRGILLMRELATEWGVEIEDGSTTIWFRIAF